MRAWPLKSLTSRNVTPPPNSLDLLKKQFAIYERDAIVVDDIGRGGHAMCGGDEEVRDRRERRALERLQRRPWLSCGRGRHAAGQVCRGPRLLGPQIGVH